MFPLEWMLVENVRKRQSLLLSKHGWEQLHRAYSKVLENEREARKQCEERVRHHAAFTHATVVLMKNRESVEEDRYKCKYCTDLPYLSIVVCGRCKCNYCLYHEFCCGCTDIKVIYRYTTEVGVLLVLCFRN